MNFAQPGYLFLLILIPILAVAAVIVSRLRQKSWAVFVAPRLRSALLKRSSPLPPWLALFFLLTACAVIILALARPRADVGIKQEKTLGRNVMVALDISKSMRVSDVKPDRLAQAKIIIYELLESMPNERIGFLGFAGSPYVYAPLTIDHSAVREVIDQIDETWAPVGGSDLAAAVHLATETLKKTGQQNNALVIISDGEEIQDESHSGELASMIAEAEQAGVYIIAIGVGTEDGGAVPNLNSQSGQMTDHAGHAIISRLQPGIMRQLAEETKGRFTIAGSGQNIPALVKSVVMGMDAFEMTGREQRRFIEFYQWLLLPAILLLTLTIVVGTRWKGVRAAIFAASAILTIPHSRANDANASGNTLAGQDYVDARNAYHQLAEKSGSSEKRARYRLGEATAAYRAGDFREARSAYSQALLSSDSEVRASGHLGLGNCLFQFSWKGLSGENYPSDSSALPDMARFDTLVKEAIAKLRAADAPEEGEAGAYVRIESLITNWADAVRHYDSTLARFPADKVARQNRKLTMAYLKRLEELLKQEKKDTEQSMPQRMPGNGPPQEGEGGDDESQDGSEGQRKDGKKGNGDKDPKDGGRKDGKKKEDDADGTDGKEKEIENPNESPEERATRILKENADLEKGQLAPGRREFKNAEKDW
jgi:Ca-activated chloride channel family protein